MGGSEVIMAALIGGLFTAGSTVVASQQGKDDEPPPPPPVLPPGEEGPNINEEAQAKRMQKLRKLRVGRHAAVVPAGKNTGTGLSIQR